MALQDLTPQLRTRLSRMERGVGWFVFLATALLIFGFAYYVYKTAERKGWFLTKAPYFTFTDRATGLKLGDPVTLMGLEVGQITRIEPEPPEDVQYNIYVEFEIKSPYYGYLWTVGSRAKVNTADFLGKRVLEVTKGTNGYPIYIFHPLRELSLAQAESLPQSEGWELAEDIYTEDANGLHLAVPALTPLTNLARLGALGRANIRVLNPRERRKSITGVWLDREGRYDHYTGSNKYWLPSEESPAVTERLEKLVGQVEKALPSFLSLTNQIGAVLANGVNLTSNLNTFAVEARPAAAHLAEISAQLRGPGALGEWMLGTNAHRQLGSTLENANAAVAHADTNLAALVENLARSLDNLAGITSNLNAQVQANTNMLSEISAAIVHADDLVQGLKRHWLLRSAFRSEVKAATNSPPGQARSPKDAGQP
jgi:ABC-type transporter Mla subunit MlaD